MGQVPATNAVFMIADVDIAGEPAAEIQLLAHNFCVYSFGESQSLKRLASF